MAMIVGFLLVVVVVAFAADRIGRRLGRRWFR